MTQIHESDLHRVQIKIGDRLYTVAEDEDGNQYWFWHDLFQAIANDIDDGTNYFTEFENASDEWKNDHTSKQRAKWILDDMRDNSTFYGDPSGYRFLEDYGIYTLANIQDK